MLVVPYLETTKKGGKVAFERQEISIYLFSLPLNTPSNTI